VAEVRVVAPTVTLVCASIETCDRVEAPARVVVMRVAPREVLLVGEVDVGAVRASFGDAAVFVDDVSDGWTAFVIEGDDAPDVFARLSELELPPEGWIQGDVARTAAKVIVEPGRLTMVVPSMLAAHVEERIRVDAAEVLSP